MKKIIAILLSVLCCVAVAGCSNDDENEGEKRLMTVQEILDRSNPSDLTCDKYDLRKYTQPLWNNQIVYNETVMFIKDEAGNIPEKKLAYPIAKVLEVRDSALAVLYEEGVDYEVTEEGNLRLLPGSSITVTEFDDYYWPEDRPGGIGAMSKSREGRFLAYGEGGTFYNKQVCVTYITVTEYGGETPVFSKDGLPKTLEKLKNREELKIIFYGDSITEGCNATGHYKIAPNTPLFYQMVVQRLRQYYGYDTIEGVNTAVGGWSSENGKSALTEKVINHNPDLVVLAFGMNDGTHGVREETFGINIDFMLQRIRNANPDCEILLVSTMLPNPDATTEQYGDFYKNQKDYLNVLNEIAAGYPGVALADVTTVHEYLLTRKDYCDMTGNNINHPSDFLVRVYAQVILSHLIEDFR